MTLTTNEATCAATIALMAHGSVMTWLMIKAQQPRENNHKMEQGSTTALRLISLTGTLVAVGLLLFEFMAAAPLQRSDLFVVASCTFTLVLSVVEWLARITFKAVSINSVAHEHLNEIVKDLTMVVEKSLTSK